VINGWPLVTLGEILAQVEDIIHLDDDTLYKQVTVKLHGKGAILRQVVSGTEIKTKRQFHVRSGQLVYSRIDARLGAVAIVPDELDGAIVSNDFPVFNFCVEQIEPRFLQYYSRTSRFLQQCDSASSGTTKRTRIKETDFLRIEIPLPPLDEQCRLVAKLDALAARVEQALALQQAAIEAREQWLMASMKAIFAELASAYGQRPLKGLFSFRYDLIRPKDKVTGEMRFIGLQHIEPHTGRRIGADVVQVEELAGRKFRFSPGEIVYGYLRPYLNKVWVADCDGLCSVDQYVLRADNSQVRTDYLAYAMRSPLFLEQSAAKTGLLTLPRLRSGLLEEIEIPVPPLDKQACIIDHLDKLQAKMGELKQMQIVTKQELDALLPSVLDKAFRGEL